MPDTTNDGFLSGQGIAVDPREIETELTRLWGPAAERIGGPDLENPHVTRIVLANLVVQGRTADGGAAPAGARHRDEQLPVPDDRAVPDRRPRPEDRGRGLGALPPASAGLPQVCSERIVLRAGPNAVDLLPGAVRPLLEADLPFVLWWTDDPRDDEALFRDLADECSRLILDLPDPGTDPAAVRLGLDLTINRYSRDTAWFGLTPLARADRAVLRPPGHTDDARADRLGPDRGRVARPTRPRPGSPSGWRPGSPGSSDGRRGDTPGGRPAASRPPSRAPGAWSPSRSRPRPSRRSRSRRSPPSP